MLLGWGSRAHIFCFLAVWQNAELILVLQFDWNFALDILITLTKNLIPWWRQTVLSIKMERIKSCRHMLYMKLLKCNKIQCFLKRVWTLQKQKHMSSPHNMYVIFILGVKLVDNEDLFVGRSVFVMTTCHWLMLQSLLRVVVGLILITLAWWSPIW